MTAGHPANHPESAESIEWDEGNEDELANHRITPEEVRQVLEGGPVWVPSRRRRAGDWKAIGPTDGGRALTVVCRYYPDRRVLRPITGWDCTKGEWSRYL